MAPCAPALTTAETAPRAPLGQHLAPCVMGRCACCLCVPACPGVRPARPGQALRDKFHMADTEVPSCRPALWLCTPSLPNPLGLRRRPSPARPLTLPCSPLCSDRVCAVQKTRFWFDPTEVLESESKQFLDKKRVGLPPRPPPRRTPRCLAAGACLWSGSFHCAVFPLCCYSCGSPVCMAPTSALRPGHAPLPVPSPPGRSRPLPALWLHVPSAATPPSGTARPAAWSHPNEWPRDGSLPIPFVHHPLSLGNKVVAYLYQIFREPCKSPSLPLSPVTLTLVPIVALTVRLASTFCNCDNMHRTVYSIPYTSFPQVSDASKYAAPAPPHAPPSRVCPGAPCAKPLRTLLPAFPAILLRCQLCHCPPPRLLLPRMTAGHIWTAPVFTGHSVAPSSSVFGKVVVCQRASVWDDVVLRGDQSTIWVGTGCQVMEGTTITTEAPDFENGFFGDVMIGQFAMIEPGCTIHAATIGGAAWIGTRCLLLRGSYVEPGARLMDGSALPAGCRVPAAEVWGGNPAKFIRKVSLVDDYDTVGVTDHYERRSALNPHGNDWHMNTSLEHREVEELSLEIENKLKDHLMSAPEDVKHMLRECTLELTKWAAHSFQSVPKTKRQRNIMSWDTVDRADY
eukprot:gene8409-1503_t